MVERITKYECGICKAAYEKESDASSCESKGIRGDEKEKGLVLKTSDKNNILTDTRISGHERTYLFLQTPGIERLSENEGFPATRQGFPELKKYSSSELDRLIDEGEVSYPGEEEKKELRDLIYNGTHPELVKTRLLLEKNGIEQFH